MGVTIFDVADAAGVSKATVSRAYTNPAAVNPDTLKRILSAAQEIGYRPNAIARAMITKRTGNFAFIIYGQQAPVITNPFYGPILESVVKAAGDTGHSMFIASDDDIQSNNGERILERQVDGIIFSSQPNLEMLHSAIRSKIPIVLINHVQDLPEAYCLLGDDKQGTEQAVEHLISLGHRRIALLDGLFTRFIRERRNTAFVETLSRCGVPFDPSLVHVVNPTMQDACNGMQQLLTRDDPPTAVFCTNDTIAAGAMKAAKRLGLRVPDDLSVIGYDNSAFCTLLEPELTSIDAQKERMGEMAVECLTAQINNTPWPAHVHTLPTRLVLRGTTGPVKE